MTDRRLHRAANGVAHDSLRGSLDGVRFVQGDWHRIVTAVAELCASPNGARDRQLMLGARFCVLTRADDWVFGFNEDDGYCGWLLATELGADRAVTHAVASPGTHLYPAADMKMHEVMALSQGVQLQVTGQNGSFAQTPLGFVPANHLRPLDQPLTDRVAVARGFLGAPYLWGGNTRAGLDCSALIQIAWHACGLTCPADSDQQMGMLGQNIPEADLAPGDLIFWPGHVAMISASGRMIHANAHHMAVVEEDYAGAVARIAAKGELVVRRLRA